MWEDAQADDAPALADKSLERFRTVAEGGRGWNYPYAGWEDVKGLWFTIF